MPEPVAVANKNGFACDAKHFIDYRTRVCNVMEHCKFAYNIEAGVGEGQSFAARLNNRTAGRMALLHSQSRHEQVQRRKQRGEAAFVSGAEVPAGGGANIEDGLGVNQAQDRMKELKTEGISLIGVHLFIASGGVGIVLALDFDAGLCIGSH